MPDPIKNLFVQRAKSSRPVWVIEDTKFESWRKNLNSPARRWLEETAFKATPGTVAVLPGSDGALSGAVAVYGKTTSQHNSLWDFAALTNRLPEGTYHFEGDFDTERANQIALACMLGAYAFDRYKTHKTKSKVKFVWPKGCARESVLSQGQAIYAVRDLINIPAADMGPGQLEKAARGIARDRGAKVRVIKGDKLKSGFPAVYAVGKAAEQAPRLIDITWGKSSHPKVTLVGKGVCFDTGGLDIKSAPGMKLMKKDMGGSAQVLGLAQMIMDARLPVRLRVLVPAVENSIAGNAMRPLDVIKTRKGISVEIGHTDAEGRVILADALHEASREAPEVIFDFATLTGAARVALGTDVPALFCNDDDLARDIHEASVGAGDPLWRLPLWPGYDKQVDGKVADVTNAPEGGFGGAITAALFLQRFVKDGIPWAHIDLMAWNTANRPGRPEGGEAQGIRALFHLLSAKYGK